jgi:polyhydroxybutyrate depolymerase
MILGACSPEATPAIDGGRSGAGGTTKTSAGGSAGTAPAAGGAGGGANVGTSMGAGGGGAGTGGVTGMGGAGTGGGAGGGSSATDADNPDSGVAPDLGGSDSTRDTASSPPRTGRSPGCGKPVMGSATSWLRHDIDVTVAVEYVPRFSKRAYFTRPPANYDPQKAYPVTFWGHGCGASGAESTPLMGGPAAQNSIHVFLLAIGGCFSTSKANSPDVPYFDLALSEIESQFCVDKSKIFVSGYSSGAWLSNLLACQRGDVIRGMGTAAGGLPIDRGTCPGPVAAIMTGDTGDTANPIVNIDKATGIDRGSGAARDRLLMENGCSKETMPWDPMFPGCVAYQGCKPGYPVVWCQTSGQGHSNGVQGGLSPRGFWKFWSTLP